METIDPVIIERTNALDPSLDFSVLREESIKLLQKLSGKTWTDFNLHDPGITILEQLCYAITDLVYRTNFSIEDVLTDLHGRINTAENSFFSKENILTTNPVTVNDFRKVILDEVSEISNVELEPVTSRFSSDYMKGLYKIMIQVNHSTARKFDEQPGLELEIVDKVKKAFLDCRNLSEDMVRKMVVLKPQKIYVHAQVVIQEHILPEELLAKVYQKIESLLCPVRKTYTEKELLDKGMSIEQIYSGPLLKHGIIPDSELQPLKREVDPTEIIREVLKIEGVLYVKNVYVNPDSNSMPGKPFVLKPDHFPLLEIDTSNPGIKLLSDKYEFEIQEQIFRNILNKNTEPTHVHRKKALQAEDVFISRGTFRNIERYFSIQDYFPVTYGIGKEGLSIHETELRKAQAKQLKAYLLFYEQVLANYLSQLANVSRLFSADLANDNNSSYYYQPLYDVPGIEDLLKPFTDSLAIDKKREWEEFKNNRKNSYELQLKTVQESRVNFQERKNKLFDHLLARFNQRVSIYPVVLYNSVYGNASEEERNTALLSWKADILKNTVPNSYNRIKAFNYTDKEENTSGFEKKMHTLLYILDKQNKVLSDVFMKKDIFFSSKKEKTDSKIPTVNKTNQDDDDILDPDMFASAEEIHKLISEDHSSWDGDKQTHYIFRDQTVALLKHGLELKNYKIGPDLHGSNYVIIYKEPSGKKWITVSRHAGKLPAVMALLKLIDFLKKLSTESEGFHIVEHILLRPAIQNDVFGFRFYHDKNSVAFANDSYTSFEKREEVISNIVSFTDTEDKSNPAHSAAFETQLKVKRHGLNNYYYNLKTGDIDNEAMYPSEKEFKNLIHGLDLFKKKKNQFFPRFDMTVKLSDNEVIKEDFFNFRITVVLPSWPARFQDREFKNFVKDLFMVAAPIYIRINIIWLDVSSMANFEDIYFQWLDAFKNNEPYEQLNGLSEKLIALIKGDTFNLY